MRPSIETCMHVLMPHKYVFHVHCVNTISYVVQKSFELNLPIEFRDINWMSIPYVKPGNTLSNLLYKNLNGKTSNVISLANHGLVVGAESIKEILSLLDMVSNLLFVYLRKIKPYDINYLEKIKLLLFIDLLSSIRLTNLLFQKMHLKLLLEDLCTLTM